MPTSEVAPDAPRARRSVPRIVGAALTFCALCVVLYFALIAALTVSVRGRPLLWWLDGLREPGGYGYALERFRDADASQPVDVVFLGSSHAYRGFDPRVFELGGYSSFNLGSTSQSPIQSYWLLHRYVDRLRPKLVVIEVTWELLELLGWESTSDIMSNMAVSREVAGMALAIHMPETINVLVGKYIHDVDFDRQHREPIPYDTYVGRGFVERNGPALPEDPIEPHTIVAKPNHLRYIGAAIELAQQHGAQVVVISQPLPPQQYEAITNRAALRETIGAICRSRGVSYLELQDLGLDSKTYYFDSDHLNHAGVVRFDTAVLKKLEEQKLLGAKVMVR